MKKEWKKLFAVLMGAAMLFSAGCGKQDSGAYERAVQALEDGNYTMAEQEFTQAEKLDGRKAEVCRGRGIMYLAQGEYDLAMTMFDQAVEEAGSKNKAFVQDVRLYQAETWLAKGDAAQAEKICEELEENTTIGEAELLLGRIALKEGDADRAAEHFSHCADIDFSYETCLAIYDLYVAHSMEADGAAYLEKGLSLVPSTAADFCDQGLLYYNLGQFENAKTSFARAIDLGNTDAVPMMGKLYLDNGEVQAARSMYQSYLNEAVRPALAYNGLALCDMADQKYDEALGNIAKGLAENDPDVRESLLLNEIAAYEHKLDFQTAKAKMQAFLQEYPDNKEANRENIFLESR
ncbi:MAG: tetratricopeptide repeat protein [Lachnospiraceae bacterium]|nr:tetratricopeptide repeat protein [Lachnospiraceae bacterium]